MPLKLPAMVAAYIAVLLAVRFFVAPAIVSSAGWTGTIAFVLGCIAIAKWLDD